MNWARIKTSFIILLLLCNLLLFFVYIEGEKDNEASASSEEELLEDISLKLQAEGVLLGGVEIPLESTLPFLKISDKNLDFDSEKSRFHSLGLKEYSEEEGSGYLFTYNLDSSFDISFFTISEDEKIAPSTREGAIKTAMNFTDIPDEDIDFVYYKDEELENGAFRIYFEESYKGIRIQDGYMIIEIKGDRVLHLKTKLVKIKEDKEKNQKLIPYSLVLYRLYSTLDEEEKPINIVGIDIVQELINKDDKDKLISGETFVYYRFTTDTGDSYLIDAIDNKKE